MKTRRTADGRKRTRQGKAKGYGDRCCQSRKQTVGPPRSQRMQPIVSRQHSNTHTLPHVFENYFSKTKLTGTFCCYIVCSLSRFSFFPFCFPMDGSQLTVSSRECTLKISEGDDSASRSAAVCGKNSLTFDGWSKRADTEAIMTLFGFVWWPLIARNRDK